MVEQVELAIRSVWAMINEKKNWNSANFLTIGRILAIPLIIFFIIKNRRIEAGILFAATALTDLLDGYIARNYNRETEFGRWLDPIADKLLVLVTLFFLDLSLWVVVPVYFREVAVMLGRLLVVNTKKEDLLQVSMHGKIKAVLQYVGIGYTILNWPSCNLVMFVVMLYTMWSGYKYFMEFRSALLK